MSEGATPPAAPGTDAGGSPFNPRTLAALIAAGVVAFLLYMVLSAYADDFRSGEDGRAHALSTSAVGFRALVRTIEAGGGRAEMIRGGDEQTGEDLMVVMLDRGVDAEALAALRSRRHNRPTLFVLPKWEVTADADRPAWVRRIGLRDPGGTAMLLRPLGGGRVSLRPSGGRIEGADMLKGFSAPAPANVQTIDGDALMPLAIVRDGGAVLAEIGDEPHYILADPDLLNNQAFASREGALAALQLIDLLNAEGAERVDFDLTLSGFGQTRNALRLAFDPPFLPLTLALLLAGILAGLHGAVRFGTPRAEGRAVAFGKAALVENSAGLFRIARREHTVGGAYAEVVRENAAFDSGAHLALSGGELDAYLDRLTPPGQPRFTEVAARLLEARNRAELLAAARALYQWKKDLLN